MKKNNHANCKNMSDPHRLNTRKKMQTPNNNMYILYGFIYMKFKNMQT